MKKHSTRNLTAHWSPMGRRLFTGHSSQGFTITELMVALVITALAMTAVYSTFIVQQRAFVVQDQVAETEGSSKIASNIITDNLRMTGYGYPVVESPSINGATDILTISDNSGINSSDTITLVGGFRQVATLSAPTTVGDTQILISYLAGAGATDFNLSNKNNLSIDGIDFAVISNCQVSGGTCSASQLITLDRGLSISFPAGRPIYLIEDISYQIVTATGSNCSNAPAGATCLTKSVAGGGSGNVDTIASNIDDLQFAYAIDTDSDGEIEDQNGNGLLDPGDYISPPLTANSRVLAVRLNLLASTANEDPSLAASSKPYYTSGIILENNTTADIDRLRRRIWSMETALRNAR